MSALMTSETKNDVTSQYNIQVFPVDFKQILQHMSNGAEVAKGKQRRLMTSQS
jgi:hypothetical protein